GKGDLVVQVQTAPGRRHVPSETMDQTGLGQLPELGVKAGRRAHAFDSTQAEHQQFGGGLAWRKLLPIGAWLRYRGDVLLWPRHVPPSRRRHPVCRVGVRARARTVNRTAPPVGLVVTGLDART